MGTQTMASQGGGGGQRSQIHGLVRQGSLYNLTLNEVQSHLGEPLQSMNLEELLKGLEDAALDPPNIPTGGPDRYSSGPTIQRQGSVTMPRSLTKKTVEEVWRDIQQGRDEGGEPTLGEMTLEDFLVKAGVVPEGTGKGRDSVVVVGPPQEYAHWLHQYHQIPVTAAYMSGGGSGQMMVSAYPEAQMSISPPTLGAMSDSQTPGRKRGHSGDKMVERRQKRMIKNRESAARSRARKQAYTNELENKVSRLEEENERLKKQKELDKLLYLPPPEPKYQIRRTSSSAF